MHRRSLLIGVIGGVLAAISTLAYASPPDPWWVPGVYDDADLDSLIVLVTSATGAADARGATALDRSPAGTTPHPFQTDARLATHFTATLHARAPPSS